MGALCGKESREGNFSGPGRRLDSTPPERATAPMPSNKRVVGGPPRTLGGGSPVVDAEGGSSSTDAADARRKAAEAAEARAKAAEGKAGKLGSQLLQQKRQTMNETLKQTAEDEARRREIETADVQRTYE